MDTPVEWVSSYDGGRAGVGFTFASACCGLKSASLSVLPHMCDVWGWCIGTTPNRLPLVGAHTNCLLKGDTTVRFLINSMFAELANSGTCQPWACTIQYPGRNNVAPSLDVRW